MQRGVSECTTMQTVVQRNAARCGAVQRSARWCKVVQLGARTILSNTARLNFVLCEATQIPKGGRECVVVNRNAARCEQVHDDAGNNATQCNEVQCGSTQCKVMHGGARTILSNTVRLNLVQSGRTGSRTVYDGHLVVNRGSVRCK